MSRYEKSDTSEIRMNREKAIAIAKSERKNQRQRHLLPLRVDKNTVIMVPKEKCTPEYAEWYRTKVIGERLTM